MMRVSEGEMIPCPGLQQYGWGARGRLRL